MGEKKDVAMLIFGLLLYIFDVGSDIFVAVELYQHGHFWWFILTLIFIILPIIIINFAACFQTGPVRSNENETETSGKICCAFSFCTCTSIIFRYKEEITRWNILNELKRSTCKQTYETCPCYNCMKYRDQQINFAKSSYELAQLHHIAAVTESAPQWCLQVYIMLRQSYFPWYTLLSTLISLLTLVWSITNIEITRHKKNGDELKFESKAVFLLSQLFSLVSRLFAIIYCAYVLKYFVFLIVVVHIVFVTPCLIFAIGHGCMDLMISLLLTFSVFFGISESLLSLEYAEAKVLIYMLQFSHGFQNVLMLSISLAFSRFDNQVWLIATACVIGGLLLGTALLICFFKSYNPGQDVQVVQIIPNDNVREKRHAGKDGPSNYGQENHVTRI
ncbi:XK-related protein 6-like [Dendronephthya gigantea]|uniref:XK-related protein 6-like n=1 Tax=Dendronephthya gigantea TaxID=151771 RepID=UPI00106D3790|nr:XK-related protein 6-like [Dendronephthya gigantea]